MVGRTEVFYRAFGGMDGIDHISLFRKSDPLLSHYHRYRRYPGLVIGLQEVMRIGRLLLGIQRETLW